jgi:pyruvate,water dikinase
MAACYGLNRFEFDPVQDVESYGVWLVDLTHFPKPPRPLNAMLWCNGVTMGTQYGAEKRSMPETKGWDMRIIDGYIYFSIMVAKPEEVPQREKVFAEQIKPLLADWEGEWQKEMARWMPIVEEFRAFDRERASNIELYEHLEDFFVRIHYGWRPIHFYWMEPTFGLYSRFAEVCQELLGMDIEDPMFKKLLSGFPNRLFQVNRDLWQFGDRATELGLADLFLTTKDDKELLSKLEESDAGRKWRGEFLDWLKVEGWRNIDLWDICSPSWIEDPSLPLRDIKQAIAKGGGFSLDAERQRLAKEREEAEKEVMAKVPSEQRDFFEKLLRVAQKSSVFSEEHNWYLDQQAAAIGRRVFLAIGNRFAQNGVIDERDDIFFLFPEEMRKALIPMERINLRPYVESRKKEWRGYFDIEPKLFYGDMAKFPQIARADAIARVVASPPRVKPELAADLYGATTAPGVVEGIARVILSERDLEQLQPGDILVTVATSVPWTPAFSIISGVVTNAGGSLSHAVLVAREYGIPAVIGTREATKKIKTGDRIKVDGDNGAVYILGKAA